MSHLKTDTLNVSDARDLLLAGSLTEGLAIIVPASQAGDDTATLMLAQVLAFQGDWPRVRSLCLHLLKQPFAFDPYLDGQDAMKLFALSVIEMGDWKEAKKRIESLRAHLESILDMSSEVNRFAEAFNRFEAFIWSEGKGKMPFRITSPVNYASMTKDQYARLSSLSQRGKKNIQSSPSSQTAESAPSFEQLDKNKQHSFYLWKALYDEDLERALQLYEDDRETFYTSLGQAVQLAHLLAADDQTERAWQILKPLLLQKTPEHPYEIVWLELLWDKKTREIMTVERCQELLISKRVGDKNADQAPYKQLRERERLNYICSLARCLTENAVGSIEEKIVDQSDDLELRLKLIGAYSKFDAQSLAKKKPHISWLIEKYPESQIIEDLLYYLFLDKETIAEDFEQFKQQWLESIEKDPSNTNILFNASLLLGVDDKALAEELLVRAQTLQPDNAKFAERLYELNAFQVKETEGRQRLLHAGEALRQVDIIEKLAASETPEPFSQLKLMRRRAWFSLEADEIEACRTLMADMLTLAKAEGVESSYQFLSQIINGRLALKRGDKANAIQYMMNTLDLEPFTHFRHDYPHLILIRDLVLAGERGAVLEFFERDRQQQLEGYPQWIERLQADIEEGKPPVVPAVML